MKVSDKTVRATATGKKSYAANWGCPQHGRVSFVGKGAEDIIRAAVAVFCITLNMQSVNALANTGTAEEMRFHVSHFLT